MELVRRGKDRRCRSRLRQRSRREDPVCRRTRILLRFNEHRGHQRKLRKLQLTGLIWIFQVFRFLFVLAPGHLNNVIDGARVDGSLHAAQRLYRYILCL
uniref:Transmembrane protein n=1 Tax=Medicago truncatula TaxID=3880 RepID=I3SQH1_MEDTR|nr:unknown [Medicago truncatula]